MIVRCVRKQPIMALYFVLKFYNLEARPYSRRIFSDWKNGSKSGRFCSIKTCAWCYGLTTICNYSVHDHHLQTVKHAKYLCATISSGISRNHFDSTVKRATNSLSFLRQNFQVCPSRVKEQCYKTLVSLTMKYASYVWDPYINSTINKLEMVQRHAVGCKSGPPSWAPPSPEQFPPPWERSNIRCGFVW